MNRLLTFLLALLLSAAGSAQTSWGVKLTVDLPVSDAGSFMSSPWSYATQNLDVVDIRGYLEAGRLGAEVRLASATSLTGGIYYVVTAAPVLGHMSESTIGFYVGRDLQSGATVFTVRGTILLFGFTGREPETPPDLPP